MPVGVAKLRDSVGKVLGVGALINLYWGGIVPRFEDMGVLGVAAVLGRPWVPLHPVPPHHAGVGDIGH